LYLVPVAGCASGLHLYIVGSLRHPLLDCMSILALTAHLVPASEPFFISSHIARFFSGELFQFLDWVLASLSIFIVSASVSSTYALPSFSSFSQ